MTGQSSSALDVVGAAGVKRDPTNVAGELVEEEGVVGGRKRGSKVSVGCARAGDGGVIVEVCDGAGDAGIDISERAAGGDSGSSGSGSLSRWLKQGRRRRAGLPSRHIPQNGGGRWGSTVGSSTSCSWVRSVGTGVVIPGPAAGAVAFVNPVDDSCDAESNGACSCSSIFMAAYESQSQTAPITKQPTLTTDLLVYVPNRSKSFCSPAMNRLEIVRLSLE